MLIKSKQIDMGKEGNKFEFFLSYELDFFQGTAVGKIISFSVIVLFLFAILISYLFQIPAWADELSDAKSDLSDSEEDVARLKEEIEGVDAEIASVYNQVQEMKGKVSEQEQTLTEATEQYEAQDRIYQQILSELEAALQEQEEIQAQVNQSVAEDEELSNTIGEIARQTYRNGSSNSVLELITSEDTLGDLTQKANTANNLIRSQSNAIEAVKSRLSSQENVSARQEDLVIRIGELEQEAADLLAQVEQYKQQVEDTYNQLQASLSELEQLEATLEAQKETASAELAVAEQERQAALARVAEINAKNYSNNTIYSTSTSGALFTFPVRGIAITVTSSFGYRLHPVTGVYKLHNGTDFAVSCGVPQYAARAGVVSAVTYETAGGNVVYVNHGLINGSSWVTAYVHLSSTAVKVGQSVDTNTIVGYTGATGYATGCHMHLTVMKDGSEVNPMNYL